MMLPYRSYLYAEKSTDRRTDGQGHPSRPSGLKREWGLKQKKIWSEERKDLVFIEPVHPESHDIFT